MAHLIFLARHLRAAKRFFSRLQGPQARARGTCQPLSLSFVNSALSTVKGPVTLHMPKHQPCPMAAASPQILKAKPCLNRYHKRLRLFCHTLKGKQLFNIVNAQSIFPTYLMRAMAAALSASGRWSVRSHAVGWFRGLTSCCTQQAALLRRHA